MLYTKDAIEQRRSIRKFKRDPIPDEHIRALIDAARLAPSGSNAQPWRFKVIKDADTRAKLAQAAYGQSFIAQAPVVVVCCADIWSYLEDITARVRELRQTSTVEPSLKQRIRERLEEQKTRDVSQMVPLITFNVAIAIEHIVLRALDFGLGSCWVRLIDEQAIKDMFGWGDEVSVVALLPIGYPDESPPPRTRHTIEDITLD